MNKVSIKEAKDLKGKRVLVRSDFNIDIDENGEIIDDMRIQRSLPTYQYLLEQGASIIAIAHLGRPEGEVVEELRMDPIAKHLSYLLGVDVKKVDDCIGGEAQEAAEKLKSGEVLFLENPRFHKEEQAGDKKFAKELASLADIFVLDAFGAVHRADASVSGVAEFLPTYAGLLIEEELHKLDTFLADPERPFVLVMGGAKLNTKIGLIRSLMTSADHILVGGALASTFAKAQGKEIGTSLFEEDLVEEAKTTLDEAGRYPGKLVLPVDFVIGEHPDVQETQVVDTDSVMSNTSILDIGPKTIEEFSKIITSAGSIAMNGAMGVFEKPAFEEGTKKIFEAVAASSAEVVVGGGETLVALDRYGAAAGVDFISTGGGAMLSYMEGADLPGLNAIPDKK